MKEALQQCRQQIDAILYDLDGTLVETAPDLCAALNHCLEVAGRDPVDLAAVHGMVGDGAKALLRKGLGKEEEDAEVDALYPTFLEYYGAHIADSSFLFPGALDLLQTAADLGYAQAVCTNKPESMSRALLAELKVDRFFKAVIGGDTLPIKKPDPEHVFATVRACAAVPERTLFIGDSANDVNAAKAAGIPVIAVSFGYCHGRPEDLGADALVDHFNEIPDAMLRLFT